MKFKNILKKIGLAGFAFAMVSGYVLAVAQPSYAIPYEGEDTPGLDHPAFNVYTGTPSVGNEADFLRGKLEGTTGYVDPVNAACADGSKFLLRVYVHNAANQGLNNGGNGPGVAHGTKVVVRVPGQVQNDFDLSSTISATNAASVTDGLDVNCTNNGKTYRMSFVRGSAFQYSIPGGTQDLSDSIVTTGAPIGTNSPNGDVWGCWDQRVWVGLTVELKEVTPPAPVYTCDLLDVVPGDNRTVRVNQFRQTASNGAVFTNAVVDWGDDSTDFSGANPVGQTHQYAKDGTYTITATAHFTVNGKDVTAAGPQCTDEVTFKADKPVPEVEELPDTGAGDLVAIFVATSFAGMLAYRVVLARKNQ